MHNTALISGKAFSETYGKQNGLVVDIGGEMSMGPCELFLKQPV